MRKIAYLLVLFILTFSLKAQTVSDSVIVTGGVHGNGYGHTIHKIMDCPLILDDPFVSNPKVIPKSALNNPEDCEYCVKGKKYKFSRTYIPFCESHLSVYHKKSNDSISYDAVCRDTTILLDGLSVEVEVSHEKLSTKRIRQIDDAHVSTTISLIGAGVFGATSVYGAVKNNPYITVPTQFLTADMISLACVSSAKSRLVESLDIFISFINKEDDEVQITDVISGRTWYLLPGQFKVLYDFDNLIGHYRIQKIGSTDSYYIGVNASNHLFKFKPVYMDGEKCALRMPEIPSIYGHYVKLNKKNAQVPVLIDTEKYTVKEITEAEYKRYSEINNDRIQ